MAILLLFAIFLCLLPFPSCSSPVIFSVLHPQLRTRSQTHFTNPLSSLSRTPVCLFPGSCFDPRSRPGSNSSSAGRNAGNHFVFRIPETNGTPPSSLVLFDSLPSSFLLLSSTWPGSSPSSSLLHFSANRENQSSSLFSPAHLAIWSIPVLRANWRIPSDFSSPLTLFTASSTSECYVAGLSSSIPWTGFLHLSFPLLLSCSSSSSLTRLHVYRNKVRHINPVRRVKHLRRNSGQTHVHELARERYLLHRQKDVRDYCRLMISPHQHLSPSSCPHSQRNAAIKHPYRGVNEARKKEFARLNREDDAKDESRLQALKAFLDQQKRLLLHTHEKDEPSSTALVQPRETEEERRAVGEKIMSAYAELQQLLKKRRMLRPLGSNKLFICNVDGRLANSDLEDFFDFFFERTQVKLHKNADGSHRGSGIIRFPDTLQATQCLLEFNGIRLGEKNIFLAEALGPPLQKKEKTTYPRPPFPNGIVSV